MRHPAVTAVAKATLAAGMAWQLGSFLPAPLHQYAYYAALGAITVLYPTVRDSTRQALAATGGILCGVLLAVGMQWLSWPNALTVAAVIGLGTAVGRLPMLGEQRSWVPMAALFVLTAATPDTEKFALGYLTQIPLGAAVGLAVNYLVLPPLPLAALHRATQRMRTLLIEQLTVTVQLLGDNAPTEEGAWHERLHDLEPAREQVRFARRQADRARAANFRRAQWANTSGTLARQALALERCSWLIEDLSLMMLEFQQGEGKVALGPELRGRAIAAFEALIALLKQAPGSDGADDVTRHGMDAALDDLIAAVDAHEFTDPETRYIVSAMALATLRCARTFTHSEAV